MDILEFLVNGQSFGVDVLKIRAIEQVDPARVTRLPRAHAALVGTLLFRGDCISLFDLRRVLAPESAATASPGPDRFVLVTDCGNCLAAVVVDGVNRIHRVNGESISPMHSLLCTPDNSFTGSLHLEDREILIMDLACLASEILRPRPAPEPLPV